MLLQLKKVYCYLFDHKFEESNVNNYYEYGNCYCLRCKQQVYPYHTLKTDYIFMKYRWRNRFNKILAKFNKNYDDDVPF